MRALVLILAFALWSCLLTTSFDRYDTTPASSDASLKSLTLAAGALSPTFAPATLAYTATARGHLFPLPVTGATTTVTAVPTQTGAVITVAGEALKSGTSAPIALAEGPNAVDIVVTAPNGSAQRHYTVTVTLTSNDYVKAAHVGANRAFGAAIALSQDTLAVGAPTEGAGAVYVFVRAGDAWTQQAVLIASNAWTQSPTQIRFGTSVALSGDTLAVGATEEASCASGTTTDMSSNALNDTNCAHSGAVYVFTRSGATWTQSSYVKPSNTASQSPNGLAFGAALALSTDTLVVGAPSEASCAIGVDGAQKDHTCPDAGAVYVYGSSGGAWSQTGYLKPSNTPAQQGGGVAPWFGSAVALSGNTIVVGAPGESSCSIGINGSQTGTSCAGAGAGYVFARSQGTWSQQAYLKSQSTAAQASSKMAFGSAVALRNDTLAIGAPHEASCAKGVGGDGANTQCANAGAVFTFARTAAKWSPLAYVKPSNTRAQAAFGSALDLGDALVVGAPGEAGCATGVGGDPTMNSCAGAGATYVFDVPSWAEQAYVKASNTRANADFGAAVSLSSNTLCIGSPRESSGTTGINGDQSSTFMPGAGAVYVF